METQMHELPEGDSQSTSLQLDGEYRSIRVNNLLPGNNIPALYDLAEDARNTAAMNVVVRGNVWEFVTVHHQDDVIKDANRDFLARLQQALRGSKVEIGISTKRTEVKQ